MSRQNPAPLIWVSSAPSTFNSCVAPCENNGARIDGRIRRPRQKYWISAQIRNFQPESTGGEGRPSEHVDKSDAKFDGPGRYRFPAVSYRGAYTGSVKCIRASGSSATRICRVGSHSRRRPARRPSRCGPGGRNSLRRPGGSAHLIHSVSTGSRNVIRKAADSECPNSVLKFETCIRRSKPPAVRSFWNWGDKSNAPRFPLAKERTSGVRNPFSGG